MKHKFVVGATVRERDGSGPVGVLHPHEPKHRPDQQHYAGEGFYFVRTFDGRVLIYHEDDIELEER